MAPSRINVRPVHLGLVFFLFACAASPSDAQQYEILHEFLPSPALPYAGLIKGSDGNFYGTTFGNGQNGDSGSVFKMTNAGTVTTLHAFGGADGRLLYGGLIQADDGNFYGTTWKGGAFDMGTVFKMDPATGAVTTLHSFAGKTINDGAYPISGVVQGIDGDFYGTTVQGGAADAGTVFKITNAGVLTILHRFSGSDGRYPEEGRLVQGSDGKFYGTTYIGGASSQGTIFSVDSAGSFTLVHSFAGTPLDGANPVAGLMIAADGNFYGTTLAGGASTNGSVFTMTASGVVSVLHSFAVADGQFPYAALIQASDGNFYGTTQTGGPANAGTIFKLDSNGVLTTLHSFTETDGAAVDAPLIEGSDGMLYGTTYASGLYGTGTIFKIDLAGNLTTLSNFPGSDGWDPYAAPIQAKDGNFYGTTWQGGVPNKGAIYKMDSSGTVSVLHSFAGEPFEGRQPQPQLVQGSDGNFYGTTYYGGNTNNGTVFKLDSLGNLITLHSFAGAPLDGAHPFSPLVQASDGSFYGTAFLGGTSNMGAVFKMDLDGNVTVVHSFAGPDGSYVFAGLIQAKDGNLYGTTYIGGTSTTSNGTIFKIDLSDNLTTLHSFNGADGWYPYGTLIQASDGNFYGTTLLGGDNNTGVIFKMEPSGNVTVLHSFSVNESEGGKPEAGLIQGNDGYLYGTAAEGGPAHTDTVPGNGTIFKIDLAGNFTPIRYFGGQDGATPIAGLSRADDGNLYGTTSRGGSWGLGVVFRLNPTLPVQLTRVVSRMIHGTAGSFDVDLTNGNGIECRSGGANNDYSLVFSFANPLLAVAGASISNGTGSVVSTSIDSNDTHNYLVNLTGVTNAQLITVSLANVRDSLGNFSSSVSTRMGVLLGDVNASGRVDAADVSAVRQQALQPITTSNFREDLNVSGRIDAADVSITRQQTLTSLP